MKPTSAALPRETTDSGLIHGPDHRQGFLQRLAIPETGLREIVSPGLAPARLFQLQSSRWGYLAETASQEGLRWAGMWVEDYGHTLNPTCCLEKEGDYLLFRTTVRAEEPELPSQTPYFPGADRLERHAQDLFGVRFRGHPDARRWTRHQAWPADQFPLRKSFPVGGFPPPEPSPADTGYPFLRAHGKSVYEIPVGPVHAGIIEPGHFRFQAVGETVLNLEERLGYVHKGIEKIAEGRDPEGLARLAGRVSGDSTVGHAWAACMAMEKAAGLEVPARALALRAICAERERIANHLWDIGAVANDVAFAFAFYQLGRIRELWLRDNQRWFGHRLLMDRIVPGGAAHDLSREGAAEMVKVIPKLHKELSELRVILDENGSVEDRWVTTGILKPEIAKALGSLGYVGRASGFDYDLRRDAPYAPYDRLRFRAACRTEGDVAARIKVRIAETEQSLSLLDQLLGDLPGGPVRADWNTPPAGAEGLGLVESWRGEVLCYVRFAEQGRIGRYFPRDPSWFSWPALEKCILGNIVPDFPVCNKSINGSYSAQDL